MKRKFQQKGLNEFKGMKYDQIYLDAKKYFQVTKKCYRKKRKKTINVLEILSSEEWVGWLFCFTAYVPFWGHLMLN